MGSNIAKLFYDDIKEKKSMLQRPTGVSQKRPRKVILPSDWIDRRKHEDYRSGKVIRYKLSEGERLGVLMDLGELNYEDLKRMNNEERKQVLEPLADQMNDKELAEKLGTNRQNVAQMRYRLGIMRRGRQSNGNGDSLGDATAQFGESPEGAVITNGKYELTVNGALREIDGGVEFTITLRTK